MQWWYKVDIFKSHIVERYKNKIKNTYTMFYLLLSNLLSNVTDQLRLLQEMDNSLKNKWILFKLKDDISQITFSEYMF